MSNVRVTIPCFGIKIYLILLYNFKYSIYFLNLLLIQTSENIRMPGRTA